MVKSIFKEIIIVLLLITVILLILGIMLYDYNPITKKVPEKVEGYQLSKEMEIELNETIDAMKTQNIVMTYEVTSTDLKKYERTKDYDKGKINPFAGIAEEINTTENTQNTNNSTSNGAGIVENTNTSQGEFLNTTGK